MISIKLLRRTQRVLHTSRSSAVRAVNRRQEPIEWAHPHNMLCRCVSKGFSSVPLSSTDISGVYTRQQPREHVLLRPEMYIGPTQRTYRDTWLQTADGGLTHRFVEVSGGLQKIFDEILVNASDNVRRDHSCKAIRVAFDQSTGQIQVWNNGSGIPVVMHDTEQMLIPELVFGHLLTGSNFDDEQKRFTGGRHGYGAKLTNIFSKSFTVETYDSERNLRYKQTWTDNMANRSKPEVKSIKTGSSFTCITFTPDYARLGYSPSELLSDSDLSILKRRVLDTAACVGRDASVFLTDQILDTPQMAKKAATSGLSSIPIDSFKQYATFFPDMDETGNSIGEKDTNRVAYLESERWKVGVMLNEMGEFQQRSFVNGVSTDQGGKHVDDVTQAIVKHVISHIKKKHPGVSVTPAHVKKHLFVFINSLIENPTFDNQMKDRLVSTKEEWGSEFKPTKLFWKSLIEDTGIIERVVATAEASEKRQLSKETKRSRSKTLSIAKLDDALLAGTNHSLDCTLILTEGDSAKALALSGLEVTGRQHYGVFPLRGKFLNVRDVSMTQLRKNQEVLSLVKILGLDFNKSYSKGPDSDMRYGKVMVMADQDHDGSHIKGLVLNFFHYFFPKLLRHDGFLQQFATPLLKARRGKEVLSFYTMQEYQEWAEEQKESLRQWKVKYYKGLGTSTGVEAREYFRDLASHRSDIRWDGKGNHVDLVFNKKKATARKKWLQDHSNPTALDHHSSEPINVEDFINHELIFFSHASNLRSIPSLIDGLKPSQRKILYACMHRKNEEIKVSQLSGYVAERTAYHHGEASLHATIVNMAQDFTGSNNLNLLTPSGQFGTRFAGGSDSASPRYIFTQLERTARLVFREEDDDLLTHTEDDGMVVEPVHFLPVIPFALVNGAAGIGTGWSTKLPCFNPLDLIESIRHRILNTNKRDKLEPWYRGFRGQIEKSSPTMYVSSGVVTETKVTKKNATVEITELPVGTWINDYKEFLIGLMETGLISSIEEHHKGDRPCFVVTIHLEKYKDLKEKGLHDELRLTKNVSLNNMTLYSLDGVLAQYKSAKSIIDEFFSFRLHKYRERKDMLILKLEGRVKMLGKRAEFIRMVREEGLLSSDMDEKAVVDTLVARGVADTPEECKSLLATPLSSLTIDRVASLEKERSNTNEKLQTIKGLSPEDLWLRDLHDLEEALMNQKGFRK